MSRKKNKKLRRNKQGDIISPVETLQCSVCRKVLYKNGQHMELPIVCECGKSRIELHPSHFIKDLKYTNVMTEIDGEIFEIV